MLQELTVEAGQLSVAGRDLTELPAAVAAKFGPTVTALDLSFNLLTYATHTKRNAAPTPPSRVFP